MIQQVKEENVNTKNMSFYYQFKKTVVNMLNKDIISKELKKFNENNFDKPAKFSQIMLEEYINPKTKDPIAEKNLLFGIVKASLINRQF
jgi:hypothetical protein